MTELFRKDEYYQAQICQHIIAATGAKTGPIDEFLIKFDYKSEKELEDQRIKEDDVFMTGLVGVFGRSK